MDRPEQPGPGPTEPDPQPSQAAPPPAPAPAQQPPAVRQANVNTLAMLCHLLALSALIGVPFGNILGPLIVWLMKKDEYPEVDAHGKASLNFQISITIYATVLALLAFILTFVLIGLLLWPVLIGLGIFWVVVVIMASVKANEGQFFDYPLSIRFIN